MLRDSSEEAQGQRSADSSQYGGASSRSESVDEGTGSCTISLPSTHMFAVQTILTLMIHVPWAKAVRRALLAELFPREPVTIWILKKVWAARLLAFLKA